ncbi:MAG: hypothetical protein HETSPECPRED_007462 [Heterodermia speciosa]|uniref:Uncharacterized protein n=1 Tax=Heterodermia speciosa TaxID=116794 RepID=A0A8H3FPH3_9LECA|nr:MAG: hypothetical protein HETSPECPRED_007462 [Heterodermia speciosa]
MLLAAASDGNGFGRALLGCVAGIGFLYGLLRVLRIGRRGRGLPPGPPTVPILGNEHQIPAADGHFLLTQWSRQYGGIFSLKRFTNTTLVISDRKLIKNLLDKQSNIYSNRPESIVARLITQGDHLLIMDYDDTWRKIRKLVHQYFMEPMCEKQHIHIQHAEATQMIRDFMLDPDHHMAHPKRYSNSITNTLVFGIRTKAIDSEYMERLYTIMEKWSLVMELGATPPVDSFPLLKLIPQRFLGNWRSRAEQVGGLMKSLYSEVLREVEERRERGVGRDSFMDRVLDGQEKNRLSRNELYFLGGVLMEGGSDTSSSLILAILLAVMAYPDVQRRAQAEIDAVMGEERSPQWSDFEKLPYINMIIKESHRWRPVSPLGVSHALGEDNEVDGMFLPKGSTVVLNVWAMHHDPATWTDPEHFIPERFEPYPALAPTYAASGAWDQRDHYGYGAGRRICPGIHLAERNLFIGVAKLLWAFDFRVKGGEGLNTSAETGLSQGFLHCVKDYGSSVTVRSKARGETILREFEEARSVFAKFE